MILFLATVFGCALTPLEAGDKLQDALMSIVDRKEDVHNAVLHVDAPSLGVTGTWAAGIADVRDGTAMTPDTPFLSASVGKLFVAATVLDLVADGALDLTDPVAAWVPPEALWGLPVVGGDAALKRITVAMLLGHRSGLPDYFDDASCPTFDGAPTVLTLMVAEPWREWSREALFDYTREHFEPCAAPGEDFLYADTNYDLLGIVIEGVTGAPYHEAVRERLIEPLGLEHTWYYNLTDPPEGLPVRADVFVDTTNLARAASLSADQAGGGLATTAADLASLLRALAEGRPVSMDLLATDWSEDALSRGIDYGYGAWRMRPKRIFFTLGGLPEQIGVSGATGAFAYRDEDDTVITGTFNQTSYAEKHVKVLLSDVLPVLARVK